MYFADDPVYKWHHRVLLMRVEGGKWIVVTPTGDIEVTNLAEAEDLVTLSRNAGFPPHCANYFGFGLAADADWSGYRLAARQLADVLGVDVTPVPADEARWYYSDPAYEKFGEVVAPEKMMAGRSIIRGTYALVEDEPEEGDDGWTVAQRLRPRDHQEWVDEKRSGAGRDPRLNEGPPTEAGRRALTSSAVSTLAATKMPGWIFEGPSASKELFAGIVTNGMEPPAYLAHYQASSGMSTTSGLAVELKVLLTVLWMLVTHDRVNVYNLAGAELISRRILMIQRAVKRNSRAPDFEGLDGYLSNTLDPLGGVLCPEFEKHISELQKTASAILKQQRLAREEAEAVASRKKKDKDGKGGGKGDKEV